VLKTVHLSAEALRMAEFIETIHDLKGDIERLERKIDYLFRHLRLDYIESDLPAYMLEATQLIRFGRRDDAVKLIREYTAVGMLEAREQVSMIERNLGITPQVAAEATNAHQLDR
jgi:hypothetical protein